MSKDLLDRALDNASRGIPAVPHPPPPGGCSCSRAAACGTNGGKHPRTEQGRHEATTDVETDQEADRNSRATQHRKH